MSEPVRSRLAGMLDGLAPKTKQPASASVLNGWISQAEQRIGSEAGGGRLGWLVASSVATAAVQRAIDADGRSLFLLKGGSLLQHRLPAATRATKDVDGLVRGDLDDFLLRLEIALSEPWGVLTLRRGPVQVIDVPTRVVKPRRFDIHVELRGVPWRRIRFEIASDEAGIGDEPEPFVPPSLAGFGVPEPSLLVGIAMRFQAAQKLHAVTDPHDPPGAVNDRARDVVDLLLIRELAAQVGHPTLPALGGAARAVFDARAREAEQLGLPVRTWPAPVVAHDHWGPDYERARASAGIALRLDEAVARVNDWIVEIAAA